MKKYLVAAAAVFGFVNFASAADMPLKAPQQATFDWSGFYIGGDAGWQGSKIGLSEPNGFGPVAYDPHQDSFALGAHVGAQHQFGQFVLGVEGAFATGFGQATFGTSGVSIFFPGGTGTAHAKANDIWSVGGRVGWASLLSRIQVEYLPSRVTVIVLPLGPVRVTVGAAAGP